MPNQIEALYKELVNADRELSKEQRYYDELQDQLMDLESERHVGTTTIQNLQADINSLTSRLLNNDTVILNKCADLENKYGKLVFGNTLPETLEEILNLSGEAKLNADNELKRIAETHLTEEQKKDTSYTIDGYNALINKLHEREQSLFEANLKYGTLPETEEELYALNEADPKDKQTIHAILDILKTSNTDIAESSQKTWDETKKEYEKIKNDYAMIRNAQKAMEAQVENLLKADLTTLRQQQNTSSTSVESADFITDESKILINGELQKHSKDLGISSLDDYFRLEKNLMDSKPDTTVIDDIPEITHFFTDFYNLTGDEAEKARQITNDLIKKHLEANPQTTGAASSVEDYENSKNLQEVWENRKYQLSEDLFDLDYISKDILVDFPEGELKNSIISYNKAQEEKDNLEIKLAISSFDEYPVKVTQIKEMKSRKPVEYEVLSEKIRILSSSDENMRATSLADKPYTADTLIQDHTEMRALEEKLKSKTLDYEKGEDKRLITLQERVREMKERLEADKKQNTNLFGHRKFTDEEIKERNALMNSLDKTNTNIKELKSTISTLVNKEVETYTNETASKKDYIKHTVVEPLQKDILNKVKEFEKQESAHKKLTEKVDHVLADFQKEQQKKLEHNKKAIIKDENLAMDKIKDAYTSADSTKTMIDKIKAENIKRKDNSSVQHVLKDLTTANREQIKQLSKKIDNVKKETESWIKEDKEARIKQIQTVNKGVTDELEDDIKSAKKDAFIAGAEAKVLGLVSKNVGGFTDLYRKKIRELSDAMIKAPRFEKEAELRALNEKLKEAGVASAFMEMDYAANSSMSSVSAMDQALINKKLNLANLNISDISKHIMNINNELHEMKLIEDQRLQENEIKFNKIFGDIIPTEREQLEKTSLAKRDSEIAAANGDQTKIDRANAEYELRKAELEAQFSEEDLKAQNLKEEFAEINEKSNEWGKLLNEANLSKIDTFVSVSEKIANYALGKLQGDDSSKGIEPIDVKASLDSIKESLTSEPDKEHVVNKLLEIGELVYHKLQSANESLNEKYQEASREHSFKHELFNTLDNDNKRFMEICEKDTENVMGESLKEKRITFLNDMQKQVSDKLNQDIMDKENAKNTMRTQVRKLNEKLIPDKEKAIAETSEKMHKSFSSISKLEEKMDELTDATLDTYRKSKKNPHITDEIHIDVNRQISNKEVIEHLTSAPLNDIPSLDDVMERIHKINMNGIGLINYIDPNDQYSAMLSASEAEQKAFAEKMLQDAGTFLKQQFGDAIIAVEQDDLLLHPVLLDGDPKKENHNKSTTRMVADFNAVRLESAKLNQMVRESEKTVASDQKQTVVSDKDKQLQETLNKAVKQSRSRVSFTSLMEAEKPAKEKRFFKRITDHFKKSKEKEANTKEVKQHTK